MEKHFSTNGSDKKTERAIFISDKLDFKTKSIAKDKHNIVIQLYSNKD